MPSGARLRVMAVEHMETAYVEVEWDEGIADAFGEKPATFGPG